MRGLSLAAASGGHSSSRYAGLSLSRPLLLRSTGSRRTGSVVVAHGSSCSAASGIFPDQGSNPCPLHWQADSQALCHQESPALSLLIINCLLDVCELLTMPSSTASMADIFWNFWHAQQNNQCGTWMALWIILKCSFRERRGQEDWVFGICSKVMTPGFSSSLIQSSARTGRSSEINMRVVYKQRWPESNTTWRLRGPLWSRASQTSILGSILSGSRIWTSCWIYLKLSFCTVKTG